MAGPLLYRRGTSSVAVGGPPSAPANDSRDGAILIDATDSFGSLEGTTAGSTIDAGGPVQFNYPDPPDIAFDYYAVYWYWDDVPAGTSIYVYVRPTTNAGRRVYFGCAIAPGLPADVDTSTTWLPNDAINQEHTNIYYGLLPCRMTAYYSAGGPATLFVYSADASLDPNEGEDEGITGPITFQIGWGFSDDPNSSHWLPEVTSTSPAGTLRPQDEPGGTTNDWLDWLVANGYREEGGWPFEENFHPDYVWGWKYTSTTGDLPTQHWLPYYGFDFWS